jgi:hypothetical protein
VLAFNLRHVWRAIRRGRKKKYCVKGDKKHGPYTKWYNNGSIAKGSWKDDKPHGTYTEWHPNGQVEVKATYKNGKLLSCEVGDCKLQCCQMNFEMFSWHPFCLARFCKL